MILNFLQIFLKGSRFRFDYPGQNVLLILGHCSLLSAALENSFKHHWILKSVNCFCWSLKTLLSAGLRPLFHHFNLAYWRNVRQRNHLGAVNLARWTHRSIYILIEIIHLCAEWMIFEKNLRFLLKMQENLQIYLKAYQEYFAWSSFQKLSRCLYLSAVFYLDTQMRHRNLAILCFPIFCLE